MALHIDNTEADQRVSQLAERMPGSLTKTGLATDILKRACADADQSFPDFILWLHGQSRPVEQPTDEAA